MNAPDFIVPPPGLIPAREPSDEPDRTIHRPPSVLPAFTPPPGIVPTPTAVPPSALIPPPGMPAVTEPVETPAARAPLGAWRLRGPGNLEVLLLRPVVLGRDPAPDPARPDAAPIPVQDPARSVSKTHALVEVVDDRVMITDLHSTNGTQLLTTAGETRELAAARPTEAPSGAIVRLGEFEVRLDRVPLDTV